MEESVNLTAWLGCDVGQAFEMFINKEYLQSWLPGLGLIQMLPNNGGKLEKIMNSKQHGNENSKNNKTSTGSKIIAYEPNKHLVFEWNSQTIRSDENSPRFHSKISINFLPMNSSKKKKKQFTEVHLTLTGLKNCEDENNETRIWIETTWSNAFERLIEHVNDMVDQ